MGLTRSIVPDSDAEILTALVAADGTSGGFIKDSQATAAGLSLLGAATAAAQEVILAAARPAFIAHKNGSDQTSVGAGAWTTITWGTEASDRGGYFATNAWTPPAGNILIGCTLQVTGTFSANTQILLRLTKGGALFQYAEPFYAIIANEHTMTLFAADVAGGTDAYGISVYTASASLTVAGGATLTRFWGLVI